MSIIYINPYQFAGLWTPADITTALWLDAADASTITESGGTVSQWDDKSGSGNHLSNATAATQPIYSSSLFGGLPTLSFTETGQEVLFNGSMTGFASNNDFFIGAVFEFKDSANNWDMICGWRVAVNTPTAGGTLLQGLSNSQQIGIHNTDQTDTRIKVDVTTRLARRIATVGRTGGTNGNGGAVTVTATEPSQANYLTTGTQTWGFAGTSGFQVGGRQQSGTSFGDKYISEIVCCSSNLSTSDRQKLEGYFAHKWNLTSALPSGHPYKTVGPTP